ncbi:MAG: tetratricopeptide repeat protein [Chlorobi bacterium]|nr:MAG: TPR repeat-containing protein [Chlorobi bacterium OLB7]MBK8910779.1 tetratricopeptide repeat protein [Chlorobiota bacterium]MBX7216046.1 tetratricopeptide repeat protein [Candidatus Kapabacteria bacterium]
MVRWLPTALTLLLLLATFGSVQSVAQDLLPEVPSTPEQDSLIAIGVHWHDRKDYDEAIEFYKKALQKNPANTIALYELAYSQYEKGEKEEALQTAMEGTRYRSQMLPQLYMVIANIHDDQGEPEKAVEIYQEALAASPDFFLLHYNLGLTFARMSRGKEAEASFQQALRLYPFHPSSHMALAQLWMARGLHAPALMAYTHFLILEGGTERAQQAAAVVEEIITGRINQKNNEKNKIYLSGSSDTSEGNFQLQEGALALMGHLNKLLDSALVDSVGAYRTDLDKYIKNIRAAVDLVAEAAEKNPVATSFTQQFYLPWYSEIVRLNHVQAFCHLVAANSMIPGAESWLTEHQKEVKAFANWMKEYRPVKPIK